MKVSFSNKARKQFLKLPKQIQSQIQKLIEKIKLLNNPRILGKALTGNLAGLWRYRSGDYRLICQIKDSQLIIFVLEIDNRKDIYRS